MAGTIDRLDATLIDWFERADSGDQLELIVEAAVPARDVAIRRGTRNQPGAADAGAGLREARASVWNSLGEFLNALLPSDDVVPLKSASAFCVLASPPQAEQILASDLVRRISSNRRRGASQ